MSDLDLKNAIEQADATISVIGQGYVGLPLALKFANAGFRTYGIDINEERVGQLLRGSSYIIDVSNEELGTAVAGGKYRPTTGFSAISESQIVVICVPTPLSKSKAPDVSFIVSAVEQIKPHLHRGMLISLESTTYPGTTEELIAGELERLHGWTAGEDFFVCFSPERVDPGNPVYHTGNTPKIVGGVTPACASLGVALYGKVLDNVVPVSSARVAEMVKLLENTFRAVNIGLVNELALMCERMQIDIWEVIDAAATKPFGFMPFYPGPGIGGHCIPLDPMYLSWKARMYDFYSKFIDLASDINGNMPRHVVSKVAEALNSVGKPLLNARVLVLGVAYKRDIDDLRESPSLEVYRFLAEAGARVDFHDPLVNVFSDGPKVLKGIELTESALAQYDCVVLATNHSVFDYRWIAEHSKLVVDTRNAFKGINSGNIIRLGTGPVRASRQWSAPKV